MPVLESMSDDNSEAKKTNLEKFFADIKSGVANIGEYISGSVTEAQSSIKKVLSGINKPSTATQKINQLVPKKVSKKPVSQKPTVSKPVTIKVSTPTFNPPTKNNVPLRVTKMPEKPVPVLKDFHGETLDTSKVSATKKKIESNVLADVKKEAQKNIRKASLKEAVRQTELFNKQLKDVFASKLNQIKDLSPNQTIQVTTNNKAKIMKVSEYKKELQKQKEAIRSNFEKQLEKGIKKYEKNELSRILSETKSSPDFAKFVGGKTIVSVYGNSNVPKPNFTTPEGEKSLISKGLRPTVTEEVKSGLRQKLGVAAGKTLAQVISLGHATPEGERLGIQMVRGASFGLLAPKSAPLTPEESIISGASSLASSEFVLAPAVSKAVTKVAEVVPKIKTALAKTPFVETRQTSKVVYNPVLEDKSFRVVAEELSGVRVGNEKIGSGVAFAVKGEGAGTKVADKFKFFGIKQKVGGGSQFIQAGTSEAGSKITYVGKEFLDLPSPFEIEIFKKTGKVPSTFRIAEQEAFKGLGEIPQELIQEGGAGIDKFLSERILNPEKGVSVFTEKRVPVESSLLKGRKRIFELISSAKRGKGFDVEFGALEGSKSLGKDILSKASKSSSFIFPNVQERIISLPVESSGAATIPIAITRTGRAKPILESARGSILEFSSVKTTGFTPEIVFEEKIVPKQGLVSLSSQVLKPSQFVHIPSTKVTLAENQNVLVAPKLKVISKQAQFEDLDVLSNIQYISKISQVSGTTQNINQKQIQIPKVTQLTRQFQIEAPKIARVEIQEQPLKFESKLTDRNVRSPLFPPLLPTKKPKNRVLKKRIKSGSKFKRRINDFFPFPDLATKTITEAKTFRPATALRKTKKNVRKLKRLFRRGITRFPTSEILSGEVNITPKGSLAVAFKEFKPKRKKKSKKKKRGLRFI